MQEMKNTKKLKTTKGEFMIDIFVCSGKRGRTECPWKKDCLRHQLYEQNIKKQIGCLWEPKKGNCVMFLHPDKYND